MQDLSLLIRSVNSSSDINDLCSVLSLLRNKIDLQKKSSYFNPASVRQDLIIDEDNDFKLYLNELEKMLFRFSGEQSVVSRIIKDIQFIYGSMKNY